MADPTEPISGKDMPAPDQIVTYADGMFGPAMFHYANETADFEAIAREHGLQVRVLMLDSDANAPSHIYELYGDGLNVFGDWHPKVPEGWKLVGKHDSEEGPMAVFVRPIPPPPDLGNQDVDLTPMSFAPPSEARK